MKSNEKGTGDKEILKVQVGPTFEVTLFLFSITQLQKTMGNQELFPRGYETQKQVIYRLNSYRQKV
ncbi:AVN_HP_G0129670.mRNA.1.CDS.1 [Saccharomyces cerevisiae]|nr:AVN_HP_G0129670.mRNA.1.CDS.1 [Saccharomyces cerevisiae]CAI6397265.1 AVN_HP_G0129670.mRNA.1.CDS.1 [Saccharomyces cerevisiae]